MRLPEVCDLSESDRNMLNLLLTKYKRRGFDVYTLEIEGGAVANTMGYQIRLRSSCAIHFDEFRFQKFSGGLLRAYWMICHRRRDEETEECFLEQLSWVKGLANALAEAEQLMSGKRTSYSNARDLSAAIINGRV